MAYRVELGFDLTSAAADAVLQITRKLLAAGQASRVKMRSTLTTPTRATSTEGHP